jgi:hypothetical protein
MVYLFSEDQQAQDQDKPTFQFKSKGRKDQYLSSRLSSRKSLPYSQKDLHFVLFRLSIDLTTPIHPGENNLLCLIYQLKC